MLILTAYANPWGGGSSSLIGKIQTKVLSKNESITFSNNVLFGFNYKYEKDYYGSSATMYTNTYISENDSFIYDKQNNTILCLSSPIVSTSTASTTNINIRAYFHSKGNSSTEFVRQWEFCNIGTMTGNIFTSFCDNLTIFYIILS